MAASGLHLDLWVSYWVAAACLSAFLGLLWLVCGEKDYDPLPGRCARPARRRFWYVVLGADDRVSTSKVPLALWTLALSYTVLVSSLHDGVYPVSPDGSYLILFAVPAAAAVGAKRITIRQIANGTSPKASAEYQRKTLYAALSEIVSDDHGDFDLSEAQYFTVSLAALVTFFVAFFRDSGTLPTLPDVLVVVTSGSAAIYVLRKAASAGLLTEYERHATVLAARLRNGRWALRGLIPAVVALGAMATIVVVDVFDRLSIQRANSPGQSRDLLAFALLCGVISFAAIEMVKRLLPVRGAVQRTALRQWWIRRARSVAVSPSTSWDELGRVMVLGSTSSIPGVPSGTGRRLSAWSMFNVPIQQLCAQLANVAEASLIEPALHLQLYYFLTRSPGDTQDLRCLVGDAVADLADDERWIVERSLAGDLPLPELSNLIPDSVRQMGVAERILTELGIPSPEDAGSIRASQQAETTLNSIRLTVGTSWKSSVEAAAVLLAGLAGLLIGLASSSQGRWLLVMVAAVIGGPLAWTISDAIAALRNWRR